MTRIGLGTSGIGKDGQVLASALALIARSAVRVSAPTSIKPPAERLNAVAQRTLLLLSFSNSMPHR